MEVLFLLPPRLKYLSPPHRTSSSCPRGTASCCVYLLCCVYLVTPHCWVICVICSHVFCWAIIITGHAAAGTRTTATGILPSFFGPLWILGSWCYTRATATGACPLRWVTRSSGRVLLVLESSTGTGEFYWYWRVLLVLVFLGAPRGYQHAHATHTSCTLSDLSLKYCQISFHSHTE